MTSLTLNPHLPKDMTTTFVKSYGVTAFTIPPDEKNKKPMYLFIKHANSNQLSPFNEKCWKGISIKDATYAMSYILNNNLVCAIEIDQNGTQNLIIHKNHEKGTPFFIVGKNKKKTTLNKNVVISKKEQETYKNLLGIYHLVLKTYFLPKMKQQAINNVGKS